MVLARRIKKCLKERHEFQNLESQMIENFHATFRGLEQKHTANGSAGGGDVQTCFKSIYMFRKDSSSRS